ncbi:transcription termination/antitermination protein NusG [Candidatus Saccharibacteria bacterium]|nr:transcription termination/antitermination protein NusG [Candidatus Saccharibacteria bacterium]
MANRFNYDNARNWYAVSTYSGHEDKVKDGILALVEDDHYKDLIFDAIVPKEKQIEIKNGKRRVADRKIFNGYVLVEMKLSDESWYAVRNVPGATGFIGTGTHPSPVSPREIDAIQRRLGSDDPKFSVKYAIGEIVRVKDGPFRGFDGSVSEIDEDKGKIKVMLSMFGRETQSELDALQVEKIS